MKILKHKLNKALKLHDNEKLTNKDILQADQQMLEVINDNRLDSVEEYEELIAWFINKLVLAIDIKEVSLEKKTVLNKIDLEIYRIITKLPTKIQADIWRLNSGSKKQLRAKLLIRTSNSNDYILAALVELFHLATLIQDDVIDQASIRRHTTTLNAKYNNRIAILISDILLVASVKVIKQEVENRIDTPQNKKLINYMQEHARDLLDSLLLSERQVETINSIEKYNEYAINKTAKLFSYSMLLGHISKFEEKTKIEDLEVLYQKGIKIGLLFQKVDDYIDYNHDVAASGKNSRDFENNIKNYMYFQLKTSSVEDIKTDLIEQIDLCISQMVEYKDVLELIKENI